MRNRAKCKLCGDIIESFHQYDKVTCKCSEISIDGGNYHLITHAKDVSNFLRVDDQGNEIVVTWKDKQEIEVIPEDFPKEPLKKEDIIQEMNMIIERISGLPEPGLNSFVTKLEFWEALILIKALLEKQYD